MHSPCLPTLSTIEEDDTFELLNSQLQAMLKRVVHSLRLVQHTDKNPRRKNNVRGTKTSPDFGLRSKDLYVRIVHHDGHQEVYQQAFPASKLMAMYPGMCVAKAEVFRAPHESVLRPEERLLLGHKYVIIPYRVVEKLKRKHSQHGKTKEPNGVVAQETLEANITRSPSGHKPKDSNKVSVPKGVASQEMMKTRITQSPNEGKIRENDEVKGAEGLGEEKVNEEINEEVYCSAKDFYISKDKSARYSRRKGIKAMKHFVPPLPKTRLYRGLGWQPKLATVQELSP